MSKISAFKGALIMANARAFDRSSSEIESVVIIRKESRLCSSECLNMQSQKQAVLEKTVNGTIPSNKLRKLFKIE